MAKRPPADLDLVNRLYARWTPYEDQRRNISDDLKELFAEGKGNGLNPKALRAAFAERYRLDNQTGDEAEKRLRNDEDFELYMSALARVREGGAEIDRSTGEIIENTEPAPTAPQLSAADVGSDPADEAEEAVPEAPSSATQSTEAGTARRDNSTEASGHGQRLDPEAAITPPASESAPVDTISETPGAGAPAAGEAVHTRTSPAVPGSTPIVRISSAPLRPFCLHQDNLTKCGGYGKVHCHDCLKAYADAEGVSA